MQINKIIFFILLVSMSIVACNKDASLVDNKNNDELSFGLIDSFQMTTKTIVDEAINGKNVSSILLGSIKDSRIGNSKASIYSQFSLTTKAIEIGENPVLDSIVLILKQSKSYGTLASPFDINVYELSSTLEKDAHYNNNTVLNIKSPPIATLNNYVFQKDESSIRIPMNNSLGQRFLDVFETTTMESSENFKEFFNGIFITTNTSAGDAIVNIDLKNDDTKIELFYHTDAVADTSYTYLVNSDDITLNQYFTDRQGSDASMASLNNNEEIAYISSMSGFKTTLNFPDLSSLKNVIINKAVLSIYQADYASPENINFPEPEKLFLFQNLMDTSLLFLPDFSLANPKPFGGEKESVEINGQITNLYKFYITKYIQALVNDNAGSRQLFITSISNNEGNRLIIGGGKNATLPIKLEILYTKTN